VCHGLTQQELLVELVVEEGRLVHAAGLVSSRWGGDAVYADAVYAVYAVYAGLEQIR
jgi:hypothetical protein